MSLILHCHLVHFLLWNDSSSELAASRPFSSFAGTMGHSSLVLTLISCCFFVAYGADIGWTGASDMNWETVTNWNTSTAPSAGDNVYILSGPCSGILLSSKAVTIAYLQVNETCGLKLNAPLTITQEKGSPVQIYGQLELYNNAYLDSTSSGSVVRRLYFTSGGKSWIYVY